MEAIQRALRVAPIDLSVLVTGESGTGKEFFPKIIHRNSPRKHATYIAVNCGAIPEGTIDSELFGHEKGSFTGAVATRKGYFEEANGGTIFLDEVAELPLTTQARLLRVLETGEYMRVGSSQVMKSNVRIVAATNVDMEKAVAEGRFREDLYYRLSTVGIYVPPLRDRGNDIIMLAEKFAEDFAEKYHTPRISLSEAADQLLRQYRSLAIAACTSLALPRPQPITPSSLPTTTMAAKLKARPPLVTLVTRLMATRRSFNSKSFVDLTLLFLAMISFKI